MDVALEPVRARGDRRNVVGARPWAAEDLADEERLIDAVVVDPDVVRGTLAVLEEELERAARRDRELGPVELVPLGGHDGAAGRGPGRRGGRARRRARRQEAPDQEQGRSATNEPVHR